MKIGLIALSGIRACDDELLRLGLTLPGFVERSRTIASLPSLGLLTLAALTPDRHQVCYREVEDVRKVGEPLEAFDLVALSSYSAQIAEAYELADRYRALGMPVVMGGLHVSSLPEEALQHADVVVLGEGEVSWPRVVADAEAGCLQPVYDGREVEFDLADAPMPAFELLDMERYNRITVQTSRGCPLRCTFCASSVLLTRRYKQKPPGRVLAEVDRVAALWPRPFLELADDNTFVGRRYWKDLLPDLARRRLRWFTETDISVGEDDELLALMRASGCAEVLIGLESPVEDGLAGLEMRTDWKRRRFPRYRELVRNIQSHGIRVNGCFVLGLDGQGPGIFDAVERAVTELELFDVQITLATPFPGTPLYEQLECQGRLLQPGAWHRCTLFDVTYRPAGMSPGELADGFRQLAVRLYSDDLTRWRKDNFRSRYMRGRQAS